MHDIYDPPPAPIAWSPPKAEPLAVSRGDLAYLAVFGFAVGLGAAWAWSVDPTLGLWATIGGGFVVLESWFSAVTFLHRHSGVRVAARWMVYFVALLPWLLGLGFATALMMGLFYVSDMNT
jgi:hypothetical protein